MLDKLFDLWDNMVDYCRFESRHDSIWYSWYLIYILTITWMLIGMYLYNPDLMAIPFWIFYL